MFLIYHIALQNSFRVKVKVSHKKSLKWLIWLSVRLRVKWLWVWVPLQVINPEGFRKFTETAMKKSIFSFIYLTKKQTSWPFLWIELNCSKTTEPPLSPQELLALIWSTWKDNRLTGNVQAFLTYTKMAHVLHVLLGFFHKFRVVAFLGYYSLLDEIRKK